MGLLVEIQDVVIDVASEGALAGANIEHPRPGWILDGDAVFIQGWALGEGVEGIEVRTDGVLTSAIPVEEERPDIVEGFPDYPEAIALRSGFKATIDLTDSPPKFELEVWASFKAGEDAMIGTLKGRHRWRRQLAPAFAELASIVISSRGGDSVLAETIESSLAQSYPYLEVVLIDGSEDGRPREIANTYEGVRVFTQDSTNGQPYNDGIRHTNGDFLVFVEAGDRLAPNALSTGIALLEGHPEWAFVRGRSRAISPDGSPLPAVFESRNESDPYETLLQGARAEPATATIYQRAVFEDVEPFDPDLGSASNLDLDLRISSRYVAGLHDEVVAEHRLRADAAREMMRDGLTALSRQRRVARRSGRGSVYRAGRKVWQYFWKAVIAQQQGGASR